MSIFGKIFSKSNQGDSGQDLAGEKPVVSLAKSSENLGKVLVSLSKESKTDMSNHTAMVVDYSGSMEKRFMDGSVQRTVTRLLPLALKFDDDGRLESWIFSNGSKKLESVSIDNYGTYAANIILGSGMEMGGTNYAPVLRDIIKYYKKHGGTVPAFIIFITDGDNSDRRETDEIIRELSHYNMFVQFVGIGKSKFKYLHALDDMDGRVCDNTGFISVSEMDKLDDETLYTELLSQYRDWLDGK